MSAVLHLRVNLNGIIQRVDCVHLLARTHIDGDSGASSACFLMFVVSRIFAVGISLYCAGLDVGQSIGLWPELPIIIYKPLFCLSCIDTGRASGHLSVSRFCSKF